MLFLFYMSFLTFIFTFLIPDLIAIPDFVSGAMEHWGLITFRETNMLVDEKTSAVSSLQQVGMVVAHELAHMWFGNLGNFDPYSSFFLFY
jgi:glutamyl aminopeptidase